MQITNQLKIVLEEDGIRDSEWMEWFLQALVDNQMYRRQIERGRRSRRGMVREVYWFLINSEHFLHFELLVSFIGADVRKANCLAWS